MRRASRLPVAILVILAFGIVGVVLYRAVAADKPHRVVLRWNAPDPKPGLTITGYNIYRSRGDGEFEPLAHVAAPSYVDNTVSRGSTYHYFIRAVAAGGDEGPPSSPISAVIP